MSVLQIDRHVVGTEQCILEFLFVAIFIRAKCLSHTFV